MSERTWRIRRHRAKEIKKFKQGLGGGRERVFGLAEK